MSTRWALFTAREGGASASKSSGGSGGSIVLMSSAAARLGSPNLYIDYAASKGAIDTLTLGLAKELGPEGVRVNAIRPGLVDTEIHASGGEPDRARILGRDRSAGPPGHGQGDRRSGDLADQRRGFLRDRRPARRLRRPLTAALSSSAPKSRSRFENQPVFCPVARAGFDPPAWDLLYEWPSELTFSPQAP